MDYRQFNEKKTGYLDSNTEPGGMYMTYRFLIAEDGSEAYLTEYMQVRK
jgi:hypothetical protein